ncbi:type IV conjugative transfer system pilin TraA [Erwinia typographi]|uniref:type IV conjugative transfer system pilin TraA n=1 Tax=Erwinia typographi TaxID=371042 RepID=UPI00068DF6D3|nr:type IV conjugative transfer system pilin TraA [Erwinia typographi]
MKGKALLFMKDCRKAGAVAWEKVKEKALMLTVAMLSVPALSAHAEDLFSGGKTTINDTFGGSSTIVWVLYLLEILMAVFTYVKTKNLIMFGGIAAVMVFINIAFSIIPS